MPSLAPHPQTQVHTSKPISQPSPLSLLPLQMLEGSPSSLKTSLEDLGAILPWLQLPLIDSSCWR